MAVYLLDTTTFSHLMRDDANVRARIGALEALGLSKKAVAQALSIAPGTVKSLSRRAMGKTTSRPV